MVEKRVKRFGQGPPPPLFGQCPKEIDFSFGGLSLCRHFSFCLPPLLCTVDQFFLLIPSESRLKNPNTCRRKSGVHSTQLLGRRWEPNCSQNPGIAKIWLTTPPPTTLGTFGLPSPHPERDWSSKCTLNASWSPN